MKFPEFASIINANIQSMCNNGTLFEVEVSFDAKDFTESSLGCTEESLLLLSNPYVPPDHSNHPICDLSTGLQDIVAKYALFHKYLSLFSSEDNPIYRTNIVHNCNCCKHFIHHFGNVVTVKDGKVTTIWDSDKLESPYKEVAEGLSTYVKQFPIKSIFGIASQELDACKKSYNLATLPTGLVVKYNHFYVTDIPSNYTSASVIGEQNTRKQLFERGLKELSLVSVTRIIDLIKSNFLYRGQEFLNITQGFHDLKQRYDTLSDSEKVLFIWEHCLSTGGRFFSSVIGTLAKDLTDGRNEDEAITSFESKMDGYQRSSAEISARSNKNAIVTIDELGLRDSLLRRHATMSDINPSNVLWINRPVTEVKDPLLVVDSTSNKRNSNTVVTIDEFIANTLPRVSTMQLYVDNQLRSNFMSITTAQVAESPSLFKWNSHFAWSYNGSNADSIRDKVAKAGGKTDNFLRVSLNWWNYDDLDIHAYEPDGREVYFGDKCGILDIDMNAQSHSTVRDAVENMTWSKKNLKKGTTKIVVNNFRLRERDNVGFLVEFECNGEIQTFKYPKAVADKQDIEVIDIHFDGETVTISKVYPGIIANMSSGSIWNVTQNSYHDVNAVMLSPNFWDGLSVGNKHWFFLLKNCKNPDPVRGFYNEFLKQELLQHRKVFEVLADRLKCEVTEDQLSGVGFSSTQHKEFNLLVKGKSINQSVTVKI